MEQSPLDALIEKIRLSRHARELFSPSALSLESPTFHASGLSANARADFSRESASPRIPTLPGLDPVTVGEVLGSEPDAEDLACLRLDVFASVRRLEQEIAAGIIAPGVCLVRGRPLGDWLDIGTVARLLASGAAASTSRAPRR